MGGRGCNRIKDDFFGQFYSTLAHQIQIAPVILYRRILIFEKYDGI